MLSFMLVLAAAMIIGFAPATITGAVATGEGAAKYRIGQVLFGPSLPKDAQCRRYRFDNKTAAMEPGLVFDCFHGIEPEPETTSDAVSPGRRLDAIRDALRSRSSGQ